MSSPRCLGCEAYDDMPCICLENSLEEKDAEIAALKQQLEMSQGRQEHWFKEAMSARGEANQLRTRLEDAEKALNEIHAEGQFAHINECFKVAKEYFRKHPPDSAKGDL